MKKYFTPPPNLGIISTQSQKTIAEPRNSTLSQTANSNTPFHRVIFVCSFFTPKARLEALSGSERQSMVACSRKGSPFAVYRLEQFSSLLHVTAKSLETLAVAVYQIQTEQIAMIFKFFCVNRTTTEQKTIFTSGAILAIFRNVLAKSNTECGNSNLYTANISTPFNYRAFFVRSLRIPKENALNLFSILLSMVGRIGQSLAIDCFPCMAVFHPDTFYRQAWKLAVVPRKIYTELSTMLFKFFCVNRTTSHYQEEIISIIANNEQEARFKLTADYRLLLDCPIARLPSESHCPDFIAKAYPSFANSRQNSTAYQSLSMH